jgi:Na+/H+ antiporter
LVISYPLKLKKIFHDYNDYEISKSTDESKLKLYIEMLVGIFLVIALALHLPTVGNIGLGCDIPFTPFKVLPMNMI